MHWEFLSIVNMLRELSWSSHLRHIVTTVVFCSMQTCQFWYCMCFDKHIGIRNVIVPCMGSVNSYHWRYFSCVFIKLGQGYRYNSATFSSSAKNRNMYYFSCYHSICHNRKGFSNPAWLFEQLFYCDYWAWLTPRIKVSSLIYLIKMVDSRESGPWLFVYWDFYYILEKVTLNKMLYFCC